MAVASAQEKGKENEQENQKEKQRDVAEVVHIEGDAESDRLDD